MTTELLERYRHKVISIDELASVIGPFPRSKTVIMCHGVFDIVHPGHIRHLAYAKSKADVLFVSITGDKEIKKGAYRPHIPEGLRALNLAAFELVDFVIVDQERTPIKNICFLQPDYFAKGFEYTENELPPATREEKEALGLYGGQMIFTPGDVVYSSSRFLGLSAPSLRVEKIINLMNQFDISFDSLRKTLGKLHEANVHVVGDTIIDTYTRTQLIGGQVKTPTFSVLYQAKEDFVGGAGIVAQHLRAAGAKVQLSTVLGSDDLMDFAKDQLLEADIEVNPIIDQTRPTTNKNTIISDGYRLLKIDTLDNRPINDEITDNLIGSIEATSSDGVVFSDFRHGIFHSGSIPQLIEAIPKHVIRVADSQVATRWGNITDFKNFDLVTPNEREARFALADQDSTIGVLATKLREATRSKNVILKLGSKGLFFIGHPDDTQQFYSSVDSFANHVTDAVGAGDALLAYATLVMLISGSLPEASIIGALAAGSECELDGNIPVRLEFVHEKLDHLEDQTKYLDPNLIQCAS